MEIIKIWPLSEENIDEASKINLEIFKNKPEDVDYPPRWFKASLEPDKHKKIYKETSTVSVRYWVAVDESSSKVVGTTGIYELEMDKEEAAWLGWFCVDEKSRGKGIGEKLLDFIIREARNMEKKYLRLYTSTDKNEEDARRLYYKKGFLKTGEEDVEGKDYMVVYMELRL